MRFSVFNCLALCTVFAVSSVFAQDKAEDYSDIFDIRHTPGSDSKPNGWFTDQGSWMGFTIPENGHFTNGFCGPFNLDHRQWVSNTIVRVGAVSEGKTIGPNDFSPLGASYFPGYLLMSSSTNGLRIEQELKFLDKNNALLQCRANKSIAWSFSGSFDLKGSNSETKGQSICIDLPSGESAVVTFADNANIELNDKGYTASIPGKSVKQAVIISFFNSKAELNAGLEKSAGLFSNHGKELHAHKERWNHYIKSILRDDMPDKYDRIAVKAMTTLISNWRSAKGDLLRDGMSPSHTFAHFNGFWAWDTWQQAVATVRFAPELAKSQVLAMFDYQDETGMVADCIKSNKERNNLRDTKPPLATWAVMEIYRRTKDKAFVEEMYPKLLKYHQWWYQYRDHDQNGICEFGSTDSTEIAARWESGMDNAVRFDHVKMLKNKDKAWSLDQESVDLNYYLAYEYSLLKELASIIDKPFSEPDRSGLIKDYFYDKEHGYFFDRKIKGDLVRVEGPEAWTPLWTKLATPTQAAAVKKIVENPEKFSTYIPFPTLAIDNPLFETDGYWRGSIWLNQVYFGISGLRKYGYVKEADQYTEEVFTRLKGLAGSAPIHENYITRTGEPARASHFSWSSAFLLMMYWDFGKPGTH